MFTPFLVLIMKTTKSENPVKYRYEDNKTREINRKAKEVRNGQKKESSTLKNKRCESENKKRTPKHKNGMFVREQGKENTHNYGSGQLLKIVMQTVALALYGDYIHKSATKACHRCMSMQQREKAWA